MSKTSTRLCSCGDIVSNNKPHMCYGKKKQHVKDEKICGHNCTVRKVTNMMLLREEGHEINV